MKKGKIKEKTFINGMTTRQFLERYHPTTTHNFEKEIRGDERSKWEHKEQEYKKEILRLTETSIMKADLILELQNENRDLKQQLQEQRKKVNDTLTSHIERLKRKQNDAMSIRGTMRLLASIRQQLKNLLESEKESKLDKVMDDGLSNSLSENPRGKEWWERMKEDKIKKILGKWSEWSKEDDLFTYCQLTENMLRQRHLSRLVELSIQSNKEDKRIEKSCR